ncbi:MAG: hypothetical protein PHT33_04170 [bacterium]|nr:hypothetical protein [bacterium]
MPVVSSNLSWIIEAIVGLVMGVLIHLGLRNANALETLGTLIVGAAGAIAGSKLVPLGPVYLGVHWIPAIIGGLLLALIWELLFQGNRSSRVIGS